VLIGRGRDVTDVALSTAYGTARLDNMEVWSEEMAVDDPLGPVPEEDADALEAAERGAAS
jgi:hypothetical protein